LILLLFEERPRAILPGLKETYEVWQVPLS